MLSKRRKERSKYFKFDLSHFFGGFQVGNCCVWFCGTKACDDTATDGNFFCFCFQIQVL